MTQEDKDRQLLLIDLSARFPYGVVIDVDTTDWKAPQGHIQIKIESYGIISKDMSLIVDGCYYGDNYKPYLRSLSSMTEEEAKELSILYGIEDILSARITDKYVEFVVDDGFCSTETRTIWYDEIISSIEIFDWLNAHYFDYRGLIEKGLAIEVTEKNNPYERID